MPIKDLIERLASDARPVQRHQIRTIIWPSLFVGTLCAFVIMAMSVGFTPNLQEADVMSQFAIRTGLGLIFVIAGLAALVPSLRPDMGSAWPERILGIALLTLVTVAVVQLASQHPSWLILYLGASVDRSPWMIVLLAIPPFVALAFAIRSEAPTHLNVTGGALGLTSGGVGAAVYAFGCDEGSTSLVLSWFSVGVVMTTLGGMLVAPRLIRW